MLSLVTLPVILIKKCMLCNCGDADMKIKYVMQIMYPTTHISVVTQSSVLRLYQCWSFFSAKRSCDPKGYFE